MQTNELTNTRLHVEVFGEGEPVIIMHGWGMHSGLFQSLATVLSDKYTVHLVDLPGHGFSGPFAAFSDINALSEFLFDELADIFQQAVTLIGWSMGGLLAQVIAGKCSDCIKNLVLVAATPCFTRRPDWQYGVHSEVLNQFAKDLVADFQDTLGRFLAIQFMGADNQKVNLRDAKKNIFARPFPNPATLEQGLALLEKTDLRLQLGKIQCPTLIINGERDSLVPPMTARILAEQIPAAQACIIRGAGHAPFLSHAERFNKSIQRFLNVQ